METTFGIVQVKSTRLAVFNEVPFDDLEPITKPAPGSEVTVEQARQAIATARRFIDVITALLA